MQSAATQKAKAERNGVPYFNNGRSHPWRVNAAYVDYKVRVPIYILIFAVYLKPQKVSGSVRRD